MEILIVTGIIVVFVLLTLWKGIKVVPQSNEYVIERFGKYTKTLNSGLNLLIPYLDKVAHNVSILERQLPAFNVSIISKDNVEVDLTTTVFYRVDDAAKSVYRISDVDSAIHTAAASIVRSAAGRLELDELQSSRDIMAKEILTNLGEAAEIWGIEITRTEVIDVIVDEQTKKSQRQQLDAERSRRATVTEAEGEKRAIELRAEATLFEAKREAEAVRIAADAEAHATHVVGEANAFAIKVQGEAMVNAPNFVELERSRKWDGKVPTTLIGGQAPAMLLNLGEAK